jgi:UDP-glucose:(heptosyl)LPS alpha-1,3-glucosyltransferase
MRLAFCLFKYFPYGGLQRDFLRIARVCLARGHRIDVYTMAWEGPEEPQLKINLIAAHGLQNHKRRTDFVKKLSPMLASEQYDLIVGFNKMPGLDVYYAADTCYQAKARLQHGFLYRLTSRYRQTVALEEAVFAADSSTEILLIAPAQQKEFTSYYGTQPERFHLLPPGIDKDRLAASNAHEIRASIRAEHKLDENEFLLLMVGSGFKTKGLTRVLRAFAALPEEIQQRTRIFVIGKDNPTTYQKMAERLAIQKQLHFLGGRDDIPGFYLAADLLLHPAFNENTGTVLLEALAGGLPVVTTDVCGYAHYVEKAQAGRVLKSPFSQREFNDILGNMLHARTRC